MFLLSRPFRRSQLAIAALFLFLGFHYATWASRLPAIKERLDLSASELGLLLLACGLGAAISFPIVATLMEKLGSRRLVYLSTAVLGALLLALAWAPTYYTALAIMFCDGIAVASLNAAMNAQGAALEVQSRQNTMSKLHATFSFGALFAALFSSSVIFLTPSLATHFSAAIVVLVLLVIFARSGLLTEDLPSPKKESNRFALPSRITFWFGFALFFGTVVEGSMNDWSALYLEEIAGASSEMAPMGIAVVSVMMVLARLFADGWRSRWGDRRVVLMGGALAGSGLALALVLGGVTPALLGFACVGLGMAAVTPIIYVAAAKHGPSALTLVAAMGVTGLLIGPPVIGFVSDASGLAWGMGFVALSAFLVSVFATQIRWSSSSGAMQQPGFLAVAEESKQAV
jgi:MFS family permease